MSKDKWPDWDVYLRDSMTCVYCGLDGRTDFRVWQQLVIDHLIPSAQGGENVEENKVVACNRCNTLKQAQRLLTEETSPRDANQRQDLIKEARQLITNTSEKNDEKTDYDLMMRELKSR
jgi:5-methylcytosine-specific restriction endonuclease McrA